MSGKNDSRDFWAFTDIPIEPLCLEHVCLFFCVGLSWSVLIILIVRIVACPLVELRRLKASTSQ